MTTGAHPWAVLLGIVTLVVGIALASAVVVADQSQPAEPAFVIELDESGDANVTLRVTFDLTTDEEAVFRDLEADASNRTTLYRDRLASVAAETENATGREMAVTDATSRTYTSGDVGVLALSVTWEGLAETTDEGLRVRQPFASGFTPPRQFVVIAPEGHEITTASPDPATIGDGRVTWTRGTELGGFIVETTADGATDTPTTATVTTDDAPTETRGPTPLPTLLAVVSLLGVGLGIARRRG